MVIPESRNDAGRKRRNHPLSERLESLETEIGRLTELLAQQAESRSRRRRRMTIRCLLAVFVAFACFFAWFGNVYHRSRRQSASVDRLIGQGAFVMYEPRESALVSLLPGDPRQPPATMVNWLGDDFFRSVSNVSTGVTTTVPRDKDEVIAALSGLEQLQRLRLTNMRLKTADLIKLSHLRNLQSLDLSRSGLDHGSIPWVRDTKMRWFNASHTNLSDRALYDLSHCSDLQELFLERTSISDQGLQQLSALTKLRYLNLKRCPVTPAAVKKLSDSLPGCMIDWEPLRFLANGRVDTRAARSGRVRYGRRMPADPRVSRRAIAPLDKNPVPQAMGGAWTIRTNVNTWPGYQLDVF